MSWWVGEFVSLLMEEMMKKRIKKFEDIEA
jgi:hypothetical protein